MKKNLFCTSILLFVLLCIGTYEFCAAETISGDLEKRLNADCVEYEGVVYRPKRRLTTVLLMGVDQWKSDASANKTYRSGGQADFLMLVVFDENNRVVTPIHINRDLMAEITIMNLLGEKIGTQVSQICMAYSYGDGDRISCELTMESLSQCFNGIQIDAYLSMRLDGIAELNDALGGVPVALEDDFSVYDPEMTEGRMLTLTGKQAEYYLRYRYEIGDGSNASRLLRQRKYMESATQVFMAQLEGSASNCTLLLDAVDPFIVTDMSRGRLINLGKQAECFSIMPIIEIEGENVVGDSGMYEFYPDQSKLLDIVLDVFYDPLI